MLEEVTGDVDGEQPYDDVSKGYMLLLLLAVSCFIVYSQCKYLNE